MRSVFNSLACMTCAMVAGFAGGRAGSLPAAPASPPGQNVVDEVRTRRLLLVNTNDEVCGGMEVGEGSSTRVTFWMQRPGEGRPMVGLWVDELEGSPEARLMLKSQSGAKGEPGVLSAVCAFGQPKVTLIFGEAASRQTILLGPHRDDSASMLSHTTDGTKTAWPE